MVARRLVAYGALWLIFDRLAFYYSSHATPWYLGTALSFYLLFAFGLRYAPAIVGIEVLRGFISSRHHLTFEWLFVLGLVTMAVVVPAVWALRRMNVRLFATFNDAVAYLAIGCVLLPIGRALSGVLILCLCGDTPWSRYWSTASSFGIGDLTGMITLVPFLTAFVTPRIAPQIAVPDEPATQQMSIAEKLLVTAFLLGGIIAGYYLVDTQNSSQVFYFVFIPLTWIALRGGLRWAIAAMLASDIAVVALHWIFKTPPSASAAYQSYIAGSSFTTLMLGVVVNQRRREEREAVEQARRDPVTGLPNRASLHEWLLSLAPRASGLALLKLDFSALRSAEEWLDPEQIRVLMLTVADRLSVCLEDALTLAQVAPDRFAAVLAGDDREHAAYQAERVLQAFEQPITLADSELFVTPVAGIAFAEAHVDPDQLLHQTAQAIRIARTRETEIAFYDAKSAGEAPLSLSTELHRALQRGEFCLYYQPIWAYDDTEHAFSALCGAEALLRWNHPDRGVLAPADFIELLESLPLSQRAGAWVLEESCRQLHEFRRVFPGCTMWINLFTRQATARTLPASIERLRALYGIPEASITIELNEKIVAIEDADLVSLTEAVHKAGARVAIDDFGKGQSSYARLREIPCDVLKIDRSFVSGPPLEGKQADILSGLVRFAHDVEMIALAEGVERNDQLAALARAGCTMAQGNILGPPLPADAFMELASQRAALL